ncbi:GNAT family N-acetyltransferase [Amycolatopsis aidingensis]|uniref:GNAT family N-acetyltransferase n=1 Tax=Amycolatopsis aidingensis TaxID=2842453 RepID=UPI001C0A9752|nr:GNAT family N-acetyltransferase [Amycolatopsis aidingensis]
MSDSEGEIQVTDNPGRSRFELHLGTELVGHAAYRRAPGLIVFTHTEVDPQRQGQGLAGRLTSESLDAARAEGSRVRAECPYVAAYIDKHPEYQELLEG